MTNAEARFSKSLRPRKPEGSLGRTAQDVHLDSHTAPVTILMGRQNICLDISYELPGTRLGEGERRGRGVEGRGAGERERAEEGEASEDLAGSRGSSHLRPCATCFGPLLAVDVHDPQLNTEPLTAPLAPSAYF